MIRATSNRSRVNYNLPAALMLATAGMAGLAAPASFADISSGVLTGGSSLTNGGMFLLIPAPAVLGNNEYDDDNVRAFNEVQDLLLADNLILDAVASGLSSNVLGAGSVVSSHYVIYDPASLGTVVFTATFDEPVLGIVTSNVRFNDTDSLLGDPGTSYAIGNQQLESPDSVTISGNTIEVSLSTSSPGDAIRVVTGIDPLPGIAICGPTSQTITGVITGGSALANGGQFKQICDPVGPVGDDNFDSFDLFAFEEQQAVELTADLFLDDTTVVSAGEFVSSFYVVWDPIPTNRVVATLTFPDTIIGVITDQVQLGDSEFLGNASATYLNPSLLGLEAGDTATINGSELTVDFNAGSPGDSVRVILGSASPSLSYTICETQDMTLSGIVTGGSAASDGGTFSQLCEPIGPVGNNNQQSNDLFAFEEAQDILLDQALDVDEPPGSTVPAGTLISSYYVAFDPGASKDIIGSITFPSTILGLATSINTLNASDDLGNPTANYLNPSLRGLEPDDFASISGNTLSVTFSADSPGDYIRVFVAVSDVDGDGVADSADNCLAAPNTDQRDTDADGIGNVCDADLDQNCLVSVVDLGIMKSVFFTTDPNADLDGDGSVNFPDLGLMKLQFFRDYATDNPSGIENLCSGSR